MFQVTRFPNDECQVDSTTVRQIMVVVVVVILVMMVVVMKVRLVMNLQVR